VIHYYEHLIDNMAEVKKAEERQKKWDTAARIKRSKMAWAV
jgi:hypothetical protein